MVVGVASSVFIRWRHNIMRVHEALITKKEWGYMARYIGMRLLYMIPILITVAILIFTLMYFVPSDPIKAMLGETATEAQIEEARERYGLNRPFTVRISEYLFNLFFKFDFGKSYAYGIDVGNALRERFPRTLQLALMCMGFSIIFGIPIGIRCAIKANRLEDRIWMALTLLFTSMPGFWLALILVLFFSLRLGWLPSTGATSIKYYILPMLANSLGSLAGIVRQTRASVLDVIRADYVVTARAKGLSENKVIWGHALPNALIPIITICGARFGFLLGGTTITESVFTIPGIGLYMITGINQRDYNVVQGSIVYIAFIFAAMMLATDVVYAFVDPRIKAQYMGKQRKKAQSTEAA